MPLSLRCAQRIDKIRQLVVNDVQLSRQLLPLVNCAHQQAWVSAILVVVRSLAGIHVRKCLRLPCRRNFCSECDHLFCDSLEVTDHLLHLVDQAKLLFLLELKFFYVVSDVLQLAIVDGKQTCVILDYIISIKLLAEDKKSSCEL